MEKEQLNNIYRKPCKFKFRGGKEVYGVIWEGESQKGDVHYFASTEDFYTINKLQNEENNILKTIINIDDIIFADQLSELIPGKDMFK